MAKRIRPNWGGGEVSGTLVKNQTMAVAYGIDEECNVSDNHFGPLLRGGQGGTRQAVAFNAVPPAPTLSIRTANTNANGHGIAEDVTHTIDQAQGQAIQRAMQVRRLTTVECERLQGFPDGYTDIKPKGKPTPDGPRYKALGNSMAVPVMAWIGKRIQMVDKL